MVFLKHKISLVNNDLYKGQVKTHTHTFSNNAERKDPLKILVETWEAYALILTKIPIS